MLDRPVVILSEVFLEDGTADALHRRLEAEAPEQK
jgi:hypothetical protein